ncbi:MAG: MBL fold metallo-hydrolase [Bacteroidia bacterium]|nr:MBL fold metallo-hydrolase [Bacteroidia bacterium]
MKNLLLFVFLFSWLTVLGQGFDDVEVKIHPVTENIFMLEGMGGNIGLSVGDDGVLLIDDQFAELGPKIESAIASVSDHPVKYLVNTHWHGDHTGSNSHFSEKGAIIIAHENVRERLSTDQVRPFRRSTPASPVSAWPELTFGDAMKIHMNGESIHLIHVHNAHTDGDAMVYFPESNVLHMGDLFFNHRFPYVDTSSGGHPDGAIKAVDAALMIADKDTKIIPGHGEQAGYQDLLDYKAMWLEMRSRVMDAIDQDVAIDTADVDALIKGYEEWEWGFIDGKKFLKMLFGAYSGE